MKVAGRGDPFQSTFEVDRKFDPNTLSTKLALPTATAAGLTEESTGLPFEMSAVGLLVRSRVATFWANECKEIISSREEHIDRPRREKTVIHSPFDSSPCLRLVSLICFTVTRRTEAQDHWILKVTK